MSAMSKTADGPEMIEALSSVMMMIVSVMVTMMMVVMMMMEVALAQLS